MWELIIVIAVVALAAFWMGRRLWRIARGGSADCGCGECSCAALQGKDQLLSAMECGKKEQGACCPLKKG